MGRVGPQRIHRSAENFDAAASIYERSRPGYHPDAIAAIARMLDLRAGRTVVDLAAGTGKFTRELVATGASVVAVEPVEGMRSVLREVLPEVDVCDGVAEAMPLDDASADAVTVAQAFHWFRGDEALAEIHRVLRPGGRLLLVWNVRDMADPLQRAVTSLAERYRGDTPAHATGAWRDAFSHTSLFDPLALTVLPGIDQWFDADDLADRVASISIVAGLPDDERARVLSEARSLLDREEMPRRFPHVTNVYTCTKR